MIIVKIYVIVSALVRIQAIEKLDEEKAESNHKDTNSINFTSPLKNDKEIQSSFQIIKSHPKDISPSEKIY